MKLFRLLAILCAAGVAFAAQPPAPLATGNLLTEAKWRFVAAGGGKGTVSELVNGTQTITADCPKGFLSWAAIDALAITPGHHYLASMTFRRDSEACIPYLMVSMNGKRTPWPFVLPEDEPNLDETISYAFTAKTDETRLSVHIIAKGQGKAIVKNVQVRELSEQELAALKPTDTTAETNFTGKKLKKFWKPFNAEKVLPGPGLAFDSAPNGGIVCDKLNWSANSIKRINVRCAGDAYGSLNLTFTTDKKASSYVALLAFPDGKPRDYSFRVAQNPAWKDTIRSIRLSWQSYESSGKLSFQRIAADSTDNILPFADEINAKSLTIRAFRPRARYSVQWLGGASPMMTLACFDEHRNQLANIIFPSFSTKAEFTAPQTVAFATLNIASSKTTTGYPCIAELQWPKPDTTFPNWRGQWIWCSAESGPADTTAWFHKTIHLQDKPAEAAAVFTADDNFTLYVNGQKTAVASDDWRVCSSGDIAKYLKKGENHIVVRVYNNSAWGGLLGELFVRDGDTNLFFPTDTSWMYHTDGSEIPNAFEHPALGLGAPPTSPWGQRMTYDYVGPKTIVTVKEARTGSAVVTVNDPVPNDTSKLQFTLTSPDGSKKDVTATVAPSTGHWRPGQDITVAVNFPPTRQARVTAALKCPYLQCETTFCNVPASLEAPPPLVKATIVDAGTRPAFVIDGKRFAPIYYDGLHKPENDWMLEKARQGGCSIVRFTLNLQSLWPEKDKFDFTKLDNMMTAYAINAPDMKAIFQLQLAMPLWWCAEYPEDCVAYDSAQPVNKEQDRQALASKRWLKDGSFAIRKIVEHIKNSWYADKIFAMAPAESWNCEWFWSATDGNRKPAISGYSVADYETFRGYLKEKYGTDAALATAWNTPNLTFENVKMPTPAELDQASALELTDPAKDAKIMDWFHFRNRALGDAIETFGKTIKEETDGKWLVGVYYGYYVMFSHINRKLQSVGHMEIERLARSPYVDMFWGPSIYHWRKLGMTDGIMQAAETLTSHGKLPIVEQDMRTFSEPASYETGHGRQDNPSQTLSAMDRAFALLATRGVGTHWYDMHELWFREKVLLDKMKEQIQLYAALPPVQGTTPPEICLVSDQESVFYTRHNTCQNVHKSTVFELIREIGKLAAPYRHVFVNDLIDGKAAIPPHKLYIVTDAVMMDKARADKLHQRFQREHATVLYLYAYGVSRPDNGPSPENMQELLGLTFRRDDTLFKPDTVKLNGGKLLPTANVAPSAPWFYPVDGFKSVMATDAKGAPVMVNWNHDGVNSIFYTYMNPSVAILQDLAMKTGVHVYANGTRHNFLIGNDLVAIIPLADGKAAINTPNKKNLHCIAGPLEGQTFKSGQDFPVESCTPCTFIVK